MNRKDFFRNARGDLSGPLDGVRVLEATTTWAGPIGGRLLADFGADVIKVEALDGEVGRHVQPMLPGTEPPVSFMHATVNCNKRSLALNLQDPEGVALFLDLAARSDIVLENFRPGTMEGLGLGYADVARVRPDIVYVSVSGFGQYGPQSDRVGYDPLAQAASGWQSLNGDPEGEPTKAPTFIADDFGGAHAALAAMAALHHRDCRGEGQHVDVALLDAMWFQSSGFLTLAAMGIDLPRMGNEYRVAAPARVYRCRDGSITAGVLLDRHWKKLARVLGRPELADDPRFATRDARLSRREEVDTLVADWMATRTVAEAAQALSAADLPAEPIRTFAEAARDPHTHARDMLPEIPQWEGTPAPITGPAAKLSRTPLRIRRAAPALGADADAILGELGLDAERIQTLRARGVVGKTPPPSPR